MVIFNCYVSSPEGTFGIFQMGEPSNESFERDEEGLSLKNDDRADETCDLIAQTS